MQGPWIFPGFYEHRIQTLRSWDKGGGGVGGGLQNIFFQPFGPQSGLKIGGGAGTGPQAPLLDLPLQKDFQVIQSPSYYLHLLGNFIF